MSLKIVKSFSLDFTKTTPLEYIFVKTGDRSSRILDITPLNSGKPYNIPDGTKALFIAKKPDDTGIIDNAEVNAENGHILVTLSDQTLAVEGVISCEIGLYGADGDYLSSQHFYMKADEHLLDGVESSNEYEALIVAMLAADQKVRDIERSATKSALRDAVVVNGEVRYPSEGLEYELNEEGESYKVVGLGTCTDINVVVPRKYNGKPITAIGDNAFEGANIDSINLWETVTNIGEEAFKDCPIRFIYIYSTTPIAVGEGAFPDTVQGYFVPLHNVEDYKADEGWANYKDKVVALETPEAIYDFILNTVVKNLSAVDTALAQMDSNLMQVDQNLIAVDTNLQSQINELKPKYSEGLEYEVVNVGGVLGFGVKGIGTCTDTDIAIPPTYNGFPVLNIMDNAFSVSGSMNFSVTVPESVVQVGINSLHVWNATFLSKTVPSLAYGSSFYDFTGSPTSPPYGTTITVRTELVDEWKAALNGKGYSGAIQNRVKHIETLNTLRADVDAKQAQIDELTTRIAELESLVKGTEE